MTDAPALSTWVEISTAALEANFRAVSAFAGVPICAVVKANAYGHGLVEASKAFVRSGATMLAVTRLEEARDLRTAGIQARILILTPPPDVGEATRLDCDIAVTSHAEIDRITAGARVHLKVDTGMGRLGFHPSEAVAAATEIARRGKLEAVWTHLPDAHGSGRRDLAKFDSAREAVMKAGIECSFHAANSAATLLLPESRYDMVRVGTLLYGENPIKGVLRISLQDPFAWYARVIAVRELPRGATVGYGSEWRAARRMRIATLPIGYRDGLTLQPLNRTESPREALRLAAIVAAPWLRIRPTYRYVQFGEVRASVVGRVAMEQISVSLEGLSEIGIGSIARIPSRRLLVSPAIPRIYI